MHHIYVYTIYRPFIYFPACTHLTSCLCFQELAAGGVAAAGHAGRQAVRQEALLRGVLRGEEVLQEGLELPLHEQHPSVHVHSLSRPAARACRPRQPRHAARRDVIAGGSSPRTHMDSL